jgi:hypothetical protein
MQVANDQRLLPRMWPAPQLLDPRRESLIDRGGLAPKFDPFRTLENKGFRAGRARPEKICELDWGPVPEAAVGPSPVVIFSP